MQEVKGIEVRMWQKRTVGTMCILPSAVRLVF